MGAEVGGGLGRGSLHTTRESGSFFSLFFSSPLQALPPHPPPPPSSQCLPASIVNCAAAAAGGREEDGERSDALLSHLPSSLNKGL